ncbi:MAG: SGNH/GDSL hydrolase family protein [Defluviitaleaceae bacterium]|nr:SGNH/GDSL hydrolase family protein [Defluviitaleaceae bacterium]
MVNIHKSIKLIILVMLIFIFGVLYGCSRQNAYDETDAISILFVGNSHVRTGNVPGQLQAIARSHGIKMSYVDVSRNGVNLDGVMRDNAMREMQNRNFDYVVIQARGRSLINDIEWFLNDIRFFSEQIREYGAIPVLYSPAWANVNGQPDEELQEFLTQVHKQAAHENDIILVNAGDAWIYAYRTIQGLSLYHRDGVHANHEGAFLTASVFAATLFDLRIENVLTGNIIDNIPMLNILTFVVFAITAFIVFYNFIKKQPLPLKKSCMVIIVIAMFQVMSFFPHVFRFTEEGSRILLLYSTIFILLTVTLYSIYYFVLIKFFEKQPWGAAKKYLFYIVACCIIYSLTFIPVFELRLVLYRGDNAFDLAQAAWNFVNSLCR